MHKLPAIAAAVLLLSPTFAHASPADDAKAPAS